MEQAMEREQEQDRYFTYGSNHKHSGRYTKIYGTRDDARDIMITVHGHEWAFQYPDAETAGVERYGLKEIY